MCRTCADELVQQQRRELDPGAAPTAAAETLAGQRQLHPKHRGKGRDDGVLIPINIHGQEAFK